MASLEIEDLKEAAVTGDVEFLKKCVASNKPIPFYSTYFPKIIDGNMENGNIFHMAAYSNREDFIREAIRILPVDDIQQLLLQPDNEVYKWNPFHVAASVGNVEIIKMFLEVYRCLQSLPSDLSKRPWLVNNHQGDNPCHLAVLAFHDECALEIFKIDPEQLCDMPNYRGASLVYEAVHYKLSKLTLEILRSTHSFRCTGGYDEGLTPFHMIHNVACSEEEAKEICRLLLQKEPGLIKKSNIHGNSAFHAWAIRGKTWPFKFFLENIDIIPDGKRVFVDLVSQTSESGRNPLHILAYQCPIEEDGIEIAKLLINVYKKEATVKASDISLEDQLPWLVQDIDGDTPLSVLMYRRFQKFAMYMLSVDENVVTSCKINALVVAIRLGCHEVAAKILEIVEKRCWYQLLSKDNLNILHLASLCKEDFCIRLIEGHPELINVVDNRGYTILHSWMTHGSETWLFEYILKSKWRSSFVKLIGCMDYNEGNNPFHIAATKSNEGTTLQLVELLVEAYKKDYPNWDVSSNLYLPWFRHNKALLGPLQVAMINKHETFALYILSLHQDDNIGTLLDYYEPKHFTLFLAIQYSCFEVAKEILARLDKSNRTEYLKNPHTGQNILHLAPYLTDVMFGTWLVNEAAEFITEKDNRGQSPWDEAYEVGTEWFIEEVLKKDPSVFDKEPLGWTKACEKGHVSALRAYVDHDPGAFRDLCIEYKDSPLHHIQLPTLTKYEEFFKFPYMKDLINLQNSQDETPLHQAIRKGDKFLTELLLSMDKILYDIKDAKDISAIDLLAQKCNEADDKQVWERMCKRIGLDPSMKTTYFRSKTNLLDVRNSLFVVAALLVTITFTAGFTIPGGFNQDNGEALLGKKASFLVFMISDTLALFFSMMVLICLIWSMVSNPSRSLVYIDRSMVLLRASLLCTLLAFMTGVYAVLAPKSLWAAIFIIIIISSLIGISIKETSLYKVLDKCMNSSTKKPRYQIHDMEQGNLDERDHLLNNGRENLTEGPESAS